jgi:DHA1 family multidrug resistance protein-like MFS transporter
VRHESRSLTPIYLLTAAMSLGYGSVIALLGEIRDQFGFSDSQVGLIAFAGFMMGFVAQVGLARFADHGHAALMVRGGIALAAVGAGWNIFADELWQWVGSRVLLGLGSGAVGPAVRRVVIARDPQHVGVNLGKQASYDIGGFVIGPLASAALAELFGIRAPFVVLCVLYAFVFFATWNIELHAGEERRTERVLRGLLARPAMQAALFASISFYLTIGMFEALWALLLEDLGARTLVVGITLSLFTLPMVIFAPRGGATAQRLGPMRVITVSIIIAALCMLAYGFLPLWLVLAVSIVHAAADSFTMPGNQVAVALSTPPEQLAAGQGLLGATGVAVAGLAALFGAKLYDVGGREVVFSITAALMLVFLALARFRGRDLVAPVIAPAPASPASPA